MAIVKTLTVEAVIRDILPSGSTVKGANRWDDCPVWPPDLFAVCGTVAKLSGCYAELGIILSQTPTQRADKRKRAAEAKRLGAEWSSSPLPPREVQNLWADFVSRGGAAVVDKSNSGKDWKRLCLHLLAISDEACAGIGYVDPDTTAVGNFALDEFLRFYRGEKLRLCLPNSITHLVSLGHACVLPKAMTPEVGCTLRSLTHHVALLPGQGVVSSEWQIVDRLKRTSEPISSAFNLLLIPFPYVVFASDFVVSRRPEDDADGYFGVQQGWLTNKGRALSSTALGAFVDSLLKVAEIECGAVHGVVFPEASLNRQLAIDLARYLAKRHPNLEYLICGAVTQAPAGRSRNEAIVFRMRNGAIDANYSQSKHHRWKLNASQIRQYQLGSVLDPNKIWWEHIDVSDRKLTFGVNRHDAVIAALVCEDLARQDPVLPTIAAIGPSLVVALLMDGPQLEKRWPGRYATVLAEDPGSSVLTLSCLGMIERSSLPGQTPKRVIGLWKDRDSSAVELDLPQHAQGLVLCLATKFTEQKTLDLRSDGANVVEYRLGGIRPVCLKNTPNWLARSP